MTFSNLLLMAIHELESNNDSKAITLLNMGVIAGDQNCIDAKEFLYEDVSYKEKVDYLKSRFQDFKLDISFDKFWHDYYGMDTLVGSRMVKINNEWLSDINFVNYLLKNEFKVLQSDIDDFWMKCNFSYNKKTLIDIVNSNINLTKFSNEEFEKIHQEISSLVYIGNTYMLIQQKKIILNGSNYNMIGNSRSGFDKFEGIITNQEDKENFKKTILKNELFINSLKKSPLGTILYDDKILGEVINGMYEAVSKFSDKMTDEQNSTLELELMLYSGYCKGKGQEFIFSDPFAIPIIVVGD